MPNGTELARASCWAGSGITVGREEMRDVWIEIFSKVFHFHHSNLANIFTQIDLHKTESYTLTF